MAAFAAIDFDHNEFGWGPTSAPELFTDVYVTPTPEILRATPPPRAAPSSSHRRLLLCESQTLLFVPKSD